LKEAIIALRMNLTENKLRILQFNWQKARTLSPITFFSVKLKQFSFLFGFSDAT